MKAEKTKQTNKKQLKVPKSPWLFYYPHPTEKEHQEEQRTRETKTRARSVWGRLPVQCPLRAMGGEALFARKGGLGRKTWEGWG